MGELAKSNPMASCRSAVPAKIRYVPARSPTYGTCNVAPTDQHIRDDGACGPRADRTEFEPSRKPSAGWPGQLNRRRQPGGLADHHQVDLSRRERAGRDNYQT